MWLMHRLRGWTAKWNWWDNRLVVTGWGLVDVTGEVTGWWNRSVVTGWQQRKLEQKSDTKSDRVVVTWWMMSNRPRSLSWRRSWAAWRASKVGWLCHLRQVAFWCVTDFRDLILDLAGFFGVLFERVISCHKFIAFKRWFHRVYFFCVRY